MLVHSSSPFSLACSTPSRSSYHSARSHQPATSSPLASPTYSSPIHDIQERRRAQYKSTTPVHCRPTNTPSSKLLLRAANPSPSDPQKTFLRERFQARCREHAQKLRERAVSARRSSDRLSDVFMDCGDDDGEDDEESDDAVMQDELFRRIMQSARHKKNHAYRVSYALEVGSSFDPDMEDPSAWESELRDGGSSSTEPTPDDVEGEFEFLEYAEKCAALADFADLDLIADDSDTDDFTPDVPRQTDQRNCQISDMDVS